MEPENVSQTQILRSMSAKDKLHAASRLYWQARRLKAAGIRRTHPQWSNEQVDQAVRELFLNART